LFDHRVIPYLREMIISRVLKIAEIDETASTIALGFSFVAPPIPPLMSWPTLAKSMCAFR
jgi:hypothetical protein